MSAKLVQVWNARVCTTVDDDHRLRALSYPWQWLKLPLAGVGSVILSSCIMWPHAYCSEKLSYLQSLVLGSTATSDNKMRIVLTRTPTEKSVIKLWMSGATGGATTTLMLKPPICISGGFFTNFASTFGWQNWFFLSRVSATRRGQNSSKKI